MADQHTYKILPEDKCLTESQLFDYIDGKLKASDMHFIEKHILSCGFCSDALEGLEKVKDRQKVAAFIPVTASNDGEEKKDEPKVIPLHPNRKYYALAAGVVLILGITLFMKLSTSGDLSGSKMADATNANDSTVLMPGKGEQDKSLLVLSDSNKLKQETVSQAAMDDKKAEQPNGGVPAPDFYTVKSIDNLQEAPAPKAADESFRADKYDGDDADDYANVVDAKPVEEQQLAKAETAKEKKAANSDKQLTLAEKTKPVSRVENDQNNKDGAVVNEDVAVQATGSTVSSGSSTTLTTPASPNNSYTWTGPTTTSTVGAANVATDSMITVLTKSDRDLDLSYENANKMLAAGQATASLSLYDEVLKNPAHAHYQDAQWKKAEALIQLKRIDEAKKLLNEIAAKPGKYKEQAKEKLKGI